MNILVTGATGFFGRAFIHVMSQSPDTFTKVAAFARSESRLALLATRHRELPGFRAFLGDVRDYDRLSDACRGMDAVVHAAALKRVDDGSYNPSEMIATNITGTQNVVKAATRAGVPRVVFISSDKSVEPINVYGATKFCAEQFAISYNAISASRGTRVSVVRYGNVIGSTGSVLGIWTRQRDAGTPLTLTNPEMSRFVMSVSDACRLVTRALDVMEGGEIFIPLLRSAFLPEMAHAVAPGHDIRFTGNRVGGEKVAEILVNEDEARRVVTLKAEGVDPLLVIPPNEPPWTADRPYAGCPEGLSHAPYRSDEKPYLLNGPEAVVYEIGRALADCVDS